MNNNWKSRFGYLMVAIGASIGLGNLWKFPYLVYRNGGAIFILVYLIIVLIMAKPMVQIETAIGRYGKADTVTVFEKINKKYGYIGWIANICTFIINFYYVVVGGWVLKYAFNFVFINDFGSNPFDYWQSFISKPFEPLLWSILLLMFVSFFLFFGITNYVEKITKILLPILFFLLLICGIYACILSPDAIVGIKYYFFPNNNFTIKAFADACTQVLFSVGIGWGLFTTLGASVPKEYNIKKDSLFIGIFDTLAGVIAGFTIVPLAFVANMNVQKGPSLVFDVMTGIYSKLPFGRIMGSFFFIAALIAVISSLFSFFEVSIKTFEVRYNIKRKKAVLISSLIIFIGNIFVSFGFGILSNISLPWLSFDGISYYNFYDWFDCFSGYILLPLGCLLTCYFVSKVWKFENYEKEVTMNGRDGKISTFDKIIIKYAIPILMLIVLLNVFGVIK